MKTDDREDELSDARYEFRVWGKQKKARKILASIADGVAQEQVSDCYLLSDRPDLNAKVRDDALKVKRLVGRRRGFERWLSRFHHEAESAPGPYAELFDDLHLDRPARGKSFDIAVAVADLDDDAAANAVFVTKDRTRYRVGTIRAEVTDITIVETGEVLRTLAMVGSDLDELVALRKRLGLKGSENVAVHVAIEDAR